MAQEVLRLHPPVSETTRVVCHRYFLLVSVPRKSYIIVFSQAAEDDIMPFLTPVKTASGEEVTSLIIKKGTVITSPIRYINRAEAFWGQNAKEFEPERWLQPDGYEKAKEIQGHRHILTFSDGPRTCLGKSFALAEFKVQFFTSQLSMMLKVNYRQCCRF